MLEGNCFRLSDRTTQSAFYYIAQIYSSDNKLNVTFELSFRNYLTLFKNPIYDTITATNQITLHLTNRFKSFSNAVVVTKKPISVVARNWLQGLQPTRLK